VDENQDELCDVCSLNLAKDGISRGGVMAIVFGAVCVSGATGFSVFWFIVKKKKWSDLVQLFLK
jgi:hypothetical protein